MSLDLKNKKTRNDIAIVGLALRVPGACDPEHFWKNLAEGRETISFFEKDELEFPEEYDLPNYVPAKGIIEGIDQFDASFFGILPMEAKIMDPQQRIFLELAWEAMERSGYTPETHQQRIGVYAGTYIDTYLLANLCTDREFLDDTIKQIRVGSLQTEIGNDKDYLATRASFKLNLTGPAMTVGTACSTSLVAIAEGCRAIRDGLCDMALAGGAAITVPHKRGYFHTEQGINSSDGHCRVFDEKGSGTVFGNGAGVVMLKRLDDAVRDRDHIHAVVRGLGLNNDGRSKQSYAAPSPEGQAEVIRMAHRDADIDPRTITAMEAHGTGTPLGDPIEFRGLTKAFRDSGVEENQFCALGSLKTFIGHLDVASGVCGVIKTALSLEKAQLPPLLHFQKANPEIDFERSPFFPSTGLSDWKPPHGIPRRAGVSSYGVGGTNAHLVMEEAPVVSSEKSIRPAQLFLLSAKTETALATAGTNLTNFAADTKSDPADTAWTLAIGRSTFKHRRAVVAADYNDLEKKLSKKAVGATGLGASGKVNFLFPGQGSQAVNMARSLYDSEPRFRETLNHCEEIVRVILKESLIDVIFPPEGADLDIAADKLRDTRFAQPAIFTIEYAIADLWQSWGILPDSMIGHSVGEFVAACHAGVFTLEDALKIVCERGRLMSDLPSGGMLSVRLSESETIARLPETLDLAAVNSPALCVVAGSHNEIEKFAAKLTAEGEVVRALHTSHAFHSRMMDPVIDEFIKAIRKIKLHAPELPILSTVTGEILTEKESTDPEYWASHLRATVHFSSAVEKLGAEAEGRIFIEVGPGQALTTLTSQTLSRKDKHLIVASCAHPKDEEMTDFTTSLQSLGRLWMAGVEVDWQSFYSHEIRKRIPLPTYPFERKRHWVDPKPCVVTQQELPVDEALLSPTSTSTQPCPTDEQGVSNQIHFQRQAESEMSNRTEAIATETRKILTDLSGIPEEELVGDATFLELGFDSLLLTQVSRAFQDGLGTEVKMRQLMTDFSTIDTLVEHFDATFDSDRFREAVAPPTAGTAAPVLTSVPAPQPMIEAPLPAPLTQCAPRVSVAPVSGDVQLVITQQLELMRQQIALLQGGTHAPAPAAVEVPVPAARIPATPPPAASAPKAALEKADTSAPSTKINRDLDNTLTDTQKGHLKKLVADYTAKTGTSKKLAAEYRQWFADPRTVSGFNRLWKEMIYQIVVKKSKGSRLLDIDGNEYVDLLNGFGPGFLGHSPDFITDALHDQLDRGVEVGPQSQDAMEAAKLFCEVTGNERASFVNTGSEAVQAAMRLSRTVTGRDKIVVFTKDYHGNFDEVLVRGVGSGDTLRSMPVAPGIPHRAVDDIIVLEYGTDESLEIIRSRANELAAVIVEPVQSRRPEFQPTEFIRALRKITEDSGTAFVFDEVITGFRAGPHGAQGFFEVEADIATYGKICGGGMPIGVVAGKAKFMDTFDGGQWQYGDESFPEQGVTFFAGTFVRHPLAMVAVKEMLLHLRERGQELWTDLNAKADRLAGTVNRMFLDNGIPFRMPNFGSLMFVRHIDDNKYANLLFFHLREKGVFLLEGFPSYITTSHTDEDIDYVIAAFRESIVEMQEAGFFPKSGESEAALNGKRMTGPERLLSADPVMTGDNGIEEKKDHPRREIYPLTGPLAEIWLACQESDDSSLCFNEVVELKFDGPLDYEALTRSLQEVVNRHEGLRTRFLENGEGFWIEGRENIDIPLTDLSGESPVRMEERFKEHLGSERLTPFDLVEGPLIRASLVKFSDNQHSLILNAHHLACDGWSYNLVTGDLGRLYSAHVRGEQVQLDPPARFGEYAERAIIEERGRSGSDREQFWLSKFDEAVPALHLPKDGTGRSYQSDRICGEVGGELLNRIKESAKGSGVTVFSLMLGTFQILLSRLGRQRRVLTLFPIAGQNQGEGIQNMVGHCVNFLPAVGDVDPEMSVKTFLRNTQEDLLDGIDYQDYSYGELIKTLPISRRPVVEAVFNLENMEGHVEFDGINTQISDVRRQRALNPLFMNALERDGSIELQMTYRTALYSEGTVRSWVNAFLGMLEAVAGNPEMTVSEVGSGVRDEDFKTLCDWNDTVTDYPRDKSIGELFDSVAGEAAQKTALSSPDGEVSYATLDEMSGKIAHFLVESGGASGDRIGIFLERSPERIAALLAVLRIGATYVPLDPTYPDDRISLMLEDCGASLVIADNLHRERFLNHEAGMIDIDSALRVGVASSAPEVLASQGGDDPAVILYTSGSTGAPKGTVIPHRAIVRLVKGTSYVPLGADTTMLHAASISFDASLFEIFGALLNGGKLVLPGKGDLTLETIADCLLQEEVTTVWLTSGLFQLMVEERIEAFRKLKYILTGGDVVPVREVSKVFETYPEINLYNGYGPTENTTFTTVHQVRKSDLASGAIPVGRPVSNSTVWILDERGKPVAPGISGELYCGGDGLALEYLNQPELTREKFVEVRLGDQRTERLYRTGDLCRHGSDGIVQFLGRIDHQVKIRGFRVEPGEIEAKLSANSLVGQCRVVSHGEGAGDKSLVAYVSPLNGYRPQAEELRDFLKASLPPYMVPSSFLIVDQLPLNENGKIDARALPDPGKTGEVSGEGKSGPPETETEKRLAGYWSDILKVRDIDRGSDFFELGGHSLLAMKLFARIQRDFDLKIPLSVLINAPGLWELAAHLEARISGEKNSLEKEPPGYISLISDVVRPAIAETTVILQPEGREPPLFGVHGGDGGVFFYQNLADRLDKDRPFCAFEAAVLSEGGDIEDEPVEKTAERYVRELLKVQQSGPFHLCGYSFGGVVAYEMACQLADAGKQVAFLGLIDTQNPALDARALSLTERVAANWTDPGNEGTGVSTKVAKLGKRIGNGLRFKFKFTAEETVAKVLPTSKSMGWLRQTQIRQAYERAMDSYHPPRFEGNVSLFRAAEGQDKHDLGPTYGWDDVVDGEVEIYNVSGNHISLLHGSNIDSLSKALQSALSKRKG